MRKLVILLLLLNGIWTVQVQTPVGNCALPTRLESGVQGRLTPGGLPNNLRQDATTAGTLIGQIPPGASFTIMDGPVCANNYVWWYVDYAGKVGWTAEGDPVERVYWLQPVLSDPVRAVDEDFVEPDGCLTPPDDYTRVQIGYATFNARTLAMLDHAQALYTAAGGIVNFRQAITQGSYTSGIEAASFGTHDGGGAVDLSVRSLADWSVLEDGIAPMLRALRIAGFAAWLREENELYPGSPIHIHAVAIGDLELSEAARAQIDGTFGYLRGYDGLPRDDAIPRLDRSGEMVICAWMIEQGFIDLTL
jgi:hypothetical protein